MAPILDYLPAFWVVTLITAGINAMITMGLYFSNSAGALSVAHAAIAGMGAYVGAVLTTNFDWPFPVAILAGALLGCALGILLSLVTLRMNELVAGLTTLAFGETMVIIAFNLDYIGGANGFIGIPLETTFTGVYGLLALVVFMAWRFDRSRLGYAARACRDNVHAAEVMGIHTAWVKTCVFALGGGIAGVGGVFRAHYVLVQNPDDMGFFFSVNYLIFWVFGGSYTLWGPLFGALFLTILPECLRFSLYDRFIIYGVILTAIVIVRRQGVLTRVPLGRRPAFVEALTSRGGRTKSVPASSLGEPRSGR
ncbi:MAG TPA: branched-chain amino acid ABC transporter permease [Candidatus Saccharimonadia bacterium]|nr:branched-chain amino acid ABC transporter permease [Candidatus Saccharimonadia bacterium]